MIDKHLDPSIHQSTHPLIHPFILAFFHSLNSIYYYCHYLGKQEGAEATLEALKAVPEPLGKWASVLVEICAYAGTFLHFSIQYLYNSMLNGEDVRNYIVSIQSFSHSLH